MKSRISFFDKGVFRKNITRFAPAWVLYTVFLLMCLMMMATDYGTNWWLATNLAEFGQFMPVINCGFALLVALLLFGDLYNSRMCNALHAMPLRRETWFGTHVTAGLLFSLVPTLVMVLLAIPMLSVPTGSGMKIVWEVAGYFLLASSLQYICFFGVAVFSALCVGSRFAMSLVYGLLNFGSLIAYWLVDTLYTPMLYGVRTQYGAFAWFSPVVRMVWDPFIEVGRIYNTSGSPLYNGITLGDHWWYLWVCAAVGMGLMALALVLYRKRKLESAGDFMAVKAMEPVFLVVYTLAMGAMFYMTEELFISEELHLFLYVGMIVGFFTGLMLLNRTTRVFRKKAILGCLAVMVLFSLTLLLTALDVFGIASWVPRAENVVSVRVTDGFDYYGRQNGITLTDQEDIRTIIGIHAQLLAGEIEEETSEMAAVEQKDGFYTYYYEDTSFSTSITYTLTDGRTVSRHYYVRTNADTGRTMEKYLSTPEAVLGMTAQEARAFAARVEDIMIDGNSIEGADATGLIEAILADCEEGTMAQNWAFHPSSAEYVWLEFDYKMTVEGDTYLRGLYVEVYSNCENTVSWLEDNGYGEYMGNIDGLLFD